MQNTSKRCVILLVCIILRWSFNYESNVYRYNKILIDCVFGNSKFDVPSTMTIDLGFALVNSQCLGDNKLAIPSYPVNKYIIYLWVLTFPLEDCSEFGNFVITHIHLAKQFERRKFAKIGQLETRIACGDHVC